MLNLGDVVNLVEQRDGETLTGVITAHTKYLVLDEVYFVRPSKKDDRWHASWFNDSELEKCTDLTEEDKDLKNELAPIVKKRNKKFNLGEVVRLVEKKDGEIVSGVITAHTEYLARDRYQIWTSKRDHRWCNNYYHESELEKCTSLTEEDKKLKNELAPERRKCV